MSTVGTARSSTPLGHDNPLVDIPSADASESELAEFALTYNGYVVHHDVATLEATARAVEEQWTSDYAK